MFESVAFAVCCNVYFLLLLKGEPSNLQCDTILYRKMNKIFTTLITLTIMQFPYFHMGESGGGGGLLIQ